MSRSGSPCAAPPVAGDGGFGGGFGVTGEIMLFGVRVTVDSMRKSVSLNNLSQYEQPHHDPSPAAAAAADVPGATAGYASADDAVPQSTTVRERKRGVPWTEEEHKLFLLGLQKVGKGDWRGISRNFVKTRTPTQVASHAQKYFLRRCNLNRRRRRSSLFDITTDAIASMEEERAQGERKTPRPSFPLPETYTAGVFPAVKIETTTEKLTLGRSDSVNDPSSPSSSSSFNRIHHPIPVPVPILPMNLDLNLNQQKPTASDPLSLSLNLSPPSDQTQSPMRSAFQASSNFKHGDSIISVA